MGLPVSRLFQFLWQRNKPPPNLAGKNNYFITLLDSVDKELGQGIAKAASLCSTMSGTSVGKSRWLGARITWRHLHSHVWRRISAIGWNLGWASPYHLGCLRGRQLQGSQRS